MCVLIHHTCTLIRITYGSLNRLIQARTESLRNKRVFIEYFNMKGDILMTGDVTSTLITMPCCSAVVNAE